MTTRILILGAGGHGQVVADVLRCMYAAGQSVYPLGYLDDDPGLNGKVYGLLRVLGQISQLPSIAHDAIIVAIGDNRVRRNLFSQLKLQGERFASAIHPRATVAADVVVGEGCVICAGVIVNTGSIIGDNVVLNTSCSVDHHNCIGSHAQIAPGAHLGGNVVVGEGALIGIGAVVLPQRGVGQWATVGAGAVVTRNIPDFATAVGLPARITGYAVS
jgi:sugar O-acyltransferase (sialic acid O-acetyltransferase NeuD family)